MSRPPVHRVRMAIAALGMALSVRMAIAALGMALSAYLLGGALAERADVAWVDSCWQRGGAVAMGITVADDTTDRVLYCRAANGTGDVIDVKVSR